jgi:hypothetical protein
MFEPIQRYSAPPADFCMYSQPPAPFHMQQRHNIPAVKPVSKYSPTMYNNHSIETGKFFLFRSGYLYFCFIIFTNVSFYVFFRTRRVPSLDCGREL